MNELETTIHIDMRKWPDHEHYQFQASLLGEDRHGRWVHVPTGTSLRRGADDQLPFEVGMVGLIPREEWWVAEFYVHHPTMTSYVNIGTPPTWTGGRVTQIDLDLDVIRTLDGTVLVIDEDEFDQNMIDYGYPTALVTGARRASERVVGLLDEGVEPFADVAAAWIARVDPKTLLRSN